jgi:hypothetical protein
MVWQNRSMRRRTGAIVVVVTIGVGWPAYALWSRHAEATRLAAVALNDEKARTLTAHLRQQLRTGSSEAEVVAYLTSNHPQYLTFPAHTKTSYAIPVGSEPSAVWYCGSFTAYVELVVESGGLSRFDTMRWSNDCL